MNVGLTAVGAVLISLYVCFFLFVIISLLFKKDVGVKVRRAKKMRCFESLRKYGHKRR